MKSRPVPERKSWRDEIMEAREPLVSESEAEPIPIGAFILAGQVRIQETVVQKNLKQKTITKQIGKVCKDNKGMFYRCPVL